MESVAEMWKTIPRFPYYEASSYGRVRSIDRVIDGLDSWGKPCLIRRRGKIPRGTPHRGYLVVKLGSPNAAYGIHQAVAMAFHGECPDGFVVDHVNTNKTDNRPDNLEYVPNETNVQRAHKNGLMHAENEGNANCKLSNISVQRIRELSAVHSLSQIAAMFGTTKTHVSRILGGKSRCNTPPAPVT